MDCPKCNSNNHRKDGFASGRQRYFCKDCKNHYSVERKSDVKPQATRRAALELYLEGLGFRSIGRLLGVSYGTVFQWVKKWGEQADLPKSPCSMEVVELDEMHTYLGSKKNYRWIWIAVDRFGKRFLAFVCGDRSTETGLRLWDEIKGHKVGFFASDHWKSYREFVPRQKHLETKAETYTVEGYNSRIRHYLARFRRKSKCYSKAEYMIIYSLKLLFLKLNNELAISV
ncbi:MAG: IS1 family transposase [Fibromonadaceae bacterium]|nr:IS1 family transposase [Fibromonadaceae bacterium]